MRKNFKSYNEEVDVTARKNATKPLLCARTANNSMRRERREGGILAVSHVRQRIYAEAKI